MIYCYGADPFGRSPSSKALNKALKEARFKLSEIKYVNSTSELPEDCHVLCFGAPAFRELTGSESSLNENRGQLHPGIVSRSILVHPTFAPGYLYRNPSLMPLFKSDLELFSCFIRMDLGEIV